MTETTTNRDPSHDPRPRCEADRNGAKTVRRRLAVRLGFPLDRNAAADAGLEVAFAGRSNVGKSSLINALTGRNGLARTSHTPGRTQELIFFEIPGKTSLRLVDMPGYGYAAAPKAQVASWTALIHKFLQGPRLAGARLRADRRAAWSQRRRSRCVQNARQGRRKLPGRADQSRPGEGRRARGLPHQNRGGARQHPRHSRRCSRPRRAPATVCRNCGAAMVRLLEERSR